MALAFTGAQGETAQEIASTMKYASNCTQEVAQNFRCILDQYQDSDLLKMANKIYVKEGKKIKDTYANTTKESYHAEAETINFSESEAAAQTINNWVENKTSGKITKLIPSQVLGDDTRLVLLNALHFKGNWQCKFDEADTHEGDFWTDAEQSVKVQYMRQTAYFNQGYFHKHKFSLLELPYKDSDLSMMILLPDERNGLKEVMEQLKDINLLELTEKISSDEIILVLPKFKVDFAVDAKNVLQEMGIEKAFSEEADFSGMLEPSEDINISNIFHKASIEVNEEGTEAAAASGAIMMARCLMSFEFIADHPFLYWIWNKKNILFAGTFVNAPKEA
uniref:Serpin domain-containing protein n=1 Tax=Stomoxys calcitrans TaxID=35570 RepID=A0A1I8PQY7_STOCA